MKKILILLFTWSLTLQLYSQKLKEGVAEFDITYPELSSDMKEMEGMLPKKMTVYFKNDHTRVELPTVMGTTATIGNSKMNEVTLLMDMMGTKMAMKISDDSVALKEEIMKKQGLFPDIKVMPSSDSKVIAGYKCKKVIISSTENGQTQKMDCFFTDELPKLNMGNDAKAFREIQGFMLEFTMKQGPISMKMTAKTVAPKNVNDTLFNIPSDYKLIRPDELKDMMSGGMGGDEKTK